MKKIFIKLFFGLGSLIIIFFTGILIVLVRAIKFFTSKRRLGKVERG